MNERDDFACVRVSVYLVCLVRVMLIEVIKDVTRTGKIELGLKVYVHGKLTGNMSLLSLVSDVVDIDFYL